MFTARPFLILYAAVTNIIVALVTTEEVQSFFLLVQALDATQICIRISQVIFESRIEIKL